MTSTLTAFLSTAAHRFALDRQAAFWLSEIDATWSLTELRARVVRVIDETHDTKTFVLAPNRLWPGHRAGQFVGIDLEIDGVRTRRCYSISSAPHERHIAITVKRVPDGRVSRFMHEHLRAGAMLRLTKPMGELVVPASRSRKLLLIAGGSGITPIMSIARDLAHHDQLHGVTLLVAARSLSDVIFATEIARLSASHPSLSVFYFLERPRPGAAPDEIEGRIDAAALARFVPDFAARQTFLCGPAPMMDGLASLWRDAGITDRLKLERFASPPRPTPHTTGRVRLRLADRVIDPANGGTLLEQLEAAGESPANGCRMGICNTCVCRKRSGVTLDLVTGATSSEPDVDIKLCTSRALSDIELAL